MSTSTALVVGLVLLAFNAFFVGAEFAIMSARRSRVEPLAATSRRARTVLWAMEHATLMMATAQLGITVCSTGIGAVAEPAIARLVEGPLVSLGLPAASSHVVGVAVALALVIYLHVVVGEMVPKNLAVTHPEQAAMWFGPPLVLITKVLSPLVKGLNELANLVLRIFGVEPKGEVASAFTADEVAGIIERSQAEGVLQDELGLLSGALEFSEKDASEVMVRDADLITMGVGATPADLEAAVARTGFSRLPVRSADGTVHGYLHVKDVLYADESTRTSPIPHWRVRALATVSTDTEIEDVLRAMQRSGTHLAGVAGPDGELVGVVFLEDILEELVGEVSDSMQRHHALP